MAWSKTSLFPIYPLRVAELPERACERASDFPHQSVKFHLVGV